MKELYAKWWFLSKFIIFMFLGMLLMKQGLGNYFELKDASSWEIIDANVLISEIEVRVNEKGATTYYPNIKYLYEIDGIEYKSDVYQIGTKNHYRYQIEIDRILQDKKVGDKIKIYVNPESLDEATIKIGKAGMELYLVGLGLFFTFLAYAINKSTIKHIFRKLFMKKYKRKNEKWIVAN